MAGLQGRRFTTREVIAIAGVSARQLQWWDERRIVVPERLGQRRAYSEADISEILVIEQLRARHVSLQRIRAVVRFLRRELGERLADMVTGSVDHHLLLDGKTLYLETSDKQVVDIIKNARQPVFVVCLSDAVRRLRVDGESTMAKRKGPESAHSGSAERKAS